MLKLTCFGLLLVSSIEIVFSQETAIYAKQTISTGSKKHTTAEYKTLAIIKTTSRLSTTSIERTSSAISTNSSTTTTSNGSLNENNHENNEKHNENTSTTTIPGVAVLVTGMWRWLVIGICLLVLLIMSCMVCLLCVRRSKKKRRRKGPFFSFDLSTGTFASNSNISSFPESSIEY